MVEGTVIRQENVVMGARQVGKTWLMEEFAKEIYGEDYVLVNFMRRKSLCQQLKTSDIDPKGLVRLLQTATGKRIIPGKTLLILDEIQECPSALTSLKFFYEDMPELAVIAAGSLLGLSFGKSSDSDTNFDDDRGSFPVGKVDRLNVYPMTFSEFLVANGKETFLEAVDAGDFESALEWLKDAGMIYRHKRVCPPGLPLSHYMKSRAFKVFLHDVGLLAAMSSVEPGIVLEKNELFSHFKGALAEQYVLQELKALDIKTGYWTPDEGTAEVDFVVQGKSAVYPLEVKAATNTKAKSLGVYMSTYKPDFAVKSSLKNFSMSRDVRSLPLYAFSRWIGRWL